MIVVADTTPLNYLVLIGEIDLLPKLYKLVLISNEVHHELQNLRTPSVVRTWAAALPEWCEIRSTVAVPDKSLIDLDPGERHAIQLALELGIDTLLMDDKEARRHAVRRRFKVTGTVAVLEAAANLGLIDFRSTLQRLERTSFRLSAPIRQTFIDRNPLKTRFPSS